MPFELSERVDCPRPISPPPGPNWVSLWHGGYAPPEVNLYTSGDLQRFAFVSILRTYEGKHVNLFELGAGYGYWSLALAKISRWPDVNLSSWRILAVEGEPTHFEWLKKCMAANGITDGVTMVHGAVDGRSGVCRFQNANDPASQFGQRILEEREPGGIEIRAYTIAELMVKYNFCDEQLYDVQLIHMDVQGREAAVIGGSLGVMGQIEHIMIETHSTKVEEQLKEHLRPTHDLIVELPRFSRIHPPGFSKPIVGHGGGVHLWRRKGLV